MPNKLLQLSKQIYMCVVGNRREAATYQKQFLTFTPWKLKHHTDWTNKRLLYFCTQRQTNKKNWQHNKMLNEKYKRKNLNRLNFEEHPQSNEKASCLFSKFEVQNQDDCNNEDCNNSTNNPLVPAHPS